MFFRYNGLGTDYQFFPIAVLLAMSADCCMHALDLKQT